MKKIPKKEIWRNYRIERDPDPNFRIFPCDFAIEEDDDGWV